MFGEPEPDSRKDHPLEKILPVADKAVPEEGNPSKFWVTGEFATVMLSCPQLTAENSNITNNNLKEIILEWKVFWIEVRICVNFLE